MNLQEAIDTIDKCPWFTNETTRVREAWVKIKDEIRSMKAEIRNKAITDIDQISEITFTTPKLRDRLRAERVESNELWEIRAREDVSGEWKTIWEGEDRPGVTFTIQQWCNAWRRGTLKNTKALGISQ